MGRTKLSHEDVKDRLEGTGLYWVGEYQGSLKKAGFGCLKCGHEWQAMPNSIFGAGSRCPRCFTFEKRGGKGKPRPKHRGSNKVLADHGEWLVLDISTTIHEGVSMLVDKDVYEKLISEIGRIGTDVNGYAKCRHGGKQMMFHRLLMVGVKEVDHINRDKLDNRRCNLRAVESWQNQANRGKRSTNTSGIIGVDFHKGRWRAQLIVKGRTVLCKKFKTKEEAALAVEEARREHRGEYAPGKG